MDINRYIRIAKRKEEIVQSRVSVTLTVNHRIMNDDELRTIIEASLLTVPLKQGSRYHSHGEIVECDVEQIKHFDD